MVKETIDMVGVVASKDQPRDPHKETSPTPGTSAGVPHTATSGGTPPAPERLCEHGLPTDPRAPEAKDKLTCLLCQEAERSTEEESGSCNDINAHGVNSDAAPLIRPEKKPQKLRRDGVISLQSIPMLSAETPCRIPKVASDPILADLYRSDSIGSFTDDINLHRLRDRKECGSQEPRGPCQLRRVHSLKSMFCLPEYDKPTSALRYQEARQCPRVTSRRNALDDPFKMPMPQETRERIEKEVSERKMSVKRKISTLFKALVEDEPEVDLL